MLRWMSRLALYAPACFLVVRHGGAGIDAVGLAAILAGVTAACLAEILPRRLYGLAAAGWLVLSAVSPLFVFFWPLLVYDIWCLRLWPLSAAAAAGGLLAAGGLSAAEWTAAAFLAGLAALFWYGTERLRRAEEELRRIRDNAVETNRALELKNSELLAAQEENIHLAALEERGRIARDIHDNVGHLLARGMMQTGALMATNADSGTGAGLEGLRDTLTEAMNSIRTSVHDLNDEAFDLYAAIRAGIRGFEALETDLSYDMGADAPRAVKTCFAAAVREALSNTVRHSDATRMTISVQEHPGFYQLAVADNGHPAAPGTAAHGMGLDSMRQRAEALGGRFSLRNAGGFGVHITIPKTKKDAYRAPHTATETEEAP